MWRRIVFLLLIVLLTAGAIISCSEIPSSRQRDLMEERYQEQQLHKAILEQSG